MSFMEVYLFKTNLADMKKNTHISRKEAILKAIKQCLLELLGDKLCNVVLFGSRAWGKPRRDSDYDLLIVLSQQYDWKLKNAIGDALYDIELQFNIITQPLVISDAEISDSLRGAQPIIQNAVKNGIYI
jgi:predicted nucleotidyltransferase